MHVKLNIGGAARLLFLSPVLLLLAQSHASRAENADTPSLTLPTPAPDAAPEVKTLKEKLSDKASDEQRVDNCHVPPDRRGTHPRPDCAPALSAPSARSN